MDGLPPPAPPVQLLADLTNANIEVNAGYSGASISVFGAVFDPRENLADVIVVVRGPEQKTSIARRERRAGLWLNGAPARVSGAPGFHLTASSRDLSRIADPLTLGAAGVGLDSLPLSVPGGAEYRQAFIRLKAREGLYAEDPGGVDFVDRGLFRAQVDLPVSAPVGRYRVEVLLFQDGKPVARRGRDLTIEKVGVERLISGFAQQRPWSYGMVCVLIALAAGWAASAAFRRV
ncbi:TIGR02186 family protein [Phenylobacterium sp.]|uniref:TIGR02186 family protein n=1 Tax=Phenylobacterium sp. TaxID=1871053 RepID=UPI0025DE0F46|nr:TIGR02186 family protein [Phenylobacterium sp.]MCA3740822.1 TIGR02186 family protein [Phenylobacterium sp.]